MVEKYSEVIPHQRVCWEMGERPVYPQKKWQGLRLPRSIESPVNDNGLDECLWDCYLCAHIYYVGP